jgi:hypothetical protein
MFLIGCVVLLGIMVCSYVLTRRPVTMTVRVVVARSSSNVVGPPTVSAVFIDLVLREYGSPAAGEGHDLYQDGVDAGIDPVFALAFFMHESSFGRKGWGAVNHSLGNIRCTPGYACQGGYRAYATWEEGFRDWYQLIRGVYVDQRGLRTVEQIVPVYAPSGDRNDVAAYIHAVNEAVATWRAGRVLVGS